MDSKPLVSLVSEDRKLISQIQSLCIESDWHLKKYGQPEDLLNQMRKSRQPVDQLNQEAKLQSVSEHMTPVVLDLDFKVPMSLEVVREIKLLHGATPIILVAKNASLAAIAVAQMDGAEAFFLQPLQDLGSIGATIQKCQDKVVHWQTALRCCCEMPEAVSMN